MKLRYHYVSLIFFLVVIGCDPAKSVGYELIVKDLENENVYLSTINIFVDFEKEYQFTKTRARINESSIEHWNYYKDNFLLQVFIDKEKDKLSILLTDWGVLVQSELSKKIEKELIEKFQNTFDEVLIKKGK